MTVEEWKQQLETWRESFEFKIRPPVDTGSLFLAFPEFKSFYEVTNGIRSEIFNVFPTYSNYDIKNTWDSLERVNNPKTTRFLNNDNDLLGRFFIFAEVGGGHCACVDRDDGSIWYEDNEGIHQTDLDLRQFIEASLLEDAE